LQVKAIKRVKGGVQKPRAWRMKRMRLSLPWFYGRGRMPEKRNGRNRAVCMGCGRKMRRPREYKGGELIRCPECARAEKAAAKS
jgi:hypothetical protein